MAILYVIGYLYILKTGCHDKQNGGQSFNLRARIAELWKLKARKMQKLHKENRLTIFKPGLWQTGFFGCSEEWYHFHQQLMVSKTIVKPFSLPYYFLCYGIIINSIRLACVKATQVAYAT